jgi:hypothetical protein
VFDGDRLIPRDSAPDGARRGLIEGEVRVGARTALVDTDADLVGALLAGADDAERAGVFDLLSADQMDVGSNSNAVTPIQIRDSVARRNRLFMMF